MTMLEKLTLEKGTVGTCLQDLSAATLPKEFAQHPSAQWLLALQRSPSRSGLNLHDTTSLHFDEPKIALAGMICREAMARLHPRAQFYFAALTHIGRMYAVSEFALSRINLLEAERNFKPSAEGLGERLKSSKLANADPAALLKRACAAAREAQRDQNRIAKQWFGFWTQEVDPLREATHLIEVAWSGIQDNLKSESFELPYALLRAILVLSSAMSRSSLLRREMELSGIRFKNGLEEGDIHGPLGNSLALLFLAAFAKQRHPEFWYYEWHHFWREMVAHEYERPIIERLRKKYEGEDPFAAYGAGGKVADTHLLAVIQENILWGNRSSPWLDIWERALPSTPFGHDWVAAADFGTDQDMAWADHADASIKRAMIHRRPSPGQPWERFIQQCFDDECVTVIGRKVGDWNRSREPADHRHSTSDVLAFFVRVVQSLNLRGYQLQPPDAETIQALLSAGSGSAS